MNLSCIRSGEKFLLQKRWVFDVENPDSPAVEASKTIKDRLAGKEADAAAGTAAVEGKGMEVAKKIEELKTLVDPLGTAVMDKFIVFLSEKGITINDNSTPQEIQVALSTKIRDLTESNLEELTRLDTGLDQVLLRVQVRKVLADSLNGLIAEGPIGAKFEEKMSTFEEPLDSTPDVGKFRSQMEVAHEFTKYAKMINHLKTGEAYDMASSKAAPEIGISYNNPEGPTYFKYWVEMGREGSQDMPVVYAIDNLHGRIQKFDPNLAKFEGDEKAWVYADNGPHAETKYTPYYQINSRFRDSSGRPIGDLLAVLPKDTDLGGTDAERAEAKSKMADNQRQERLFISGERRNYTPATGMTAEEARIYPEFEQRYREAEVRNGDHPQGNFLRGLHRSMSGTEGISLAQEAMITERDIPDIIEARADGNRIKRGEITIAAEGSKDLLRVKDAATNNSLEIRDSKLENTVSKNPIDFSGKLEIKDGVVRVKNESTSEMKIPSGSTLNLTIVEKNSEDKVVGIRILPIVFENPPELLKDVKFNIQSDPDEVKENSDGEYELFTGKIDTNKQLLRFEELGTGIGIKQASTEPRVGKQQFDWSFFQISQTGIKFISQPEGKGKLNIEVGAEITIPIVLNRGGETSERNIKIIIKATLEEAAPTPATGASAAPAEGGAPEEEGAPVEEPPAAAAEGGAPEENAGSAAGETPAEEAPAEDVSAEDSSPEIAQRIELPQEFIEAGFRLEKADKDGKYIINSTINGQNVRYTWENMDPEQVVIIVPTNNTDLHHVTERGASPTSFVNEGDKFIIEYSNGAKDILTIKDGKISYMDIDQNPDKWPDLQNLEYAAPDRSAEQQESSLEDVETETTLPEAFKEAGFRVIKNEETLNTTRGQFGYTGDNPNQIAIGVPAMYIHEGKELPFTLSEDGAKPTSFRKVGNDYIIVYSNGLEDTVKIENGKVTYINRIDDERDFSSFKNLDHIQNLYD